jgi:hypothetical protein
MNYAEAIFQRSLQLPDAAAREVLDFIDFLIQQRVRPGKTTLAQQVRDPEQLLNAIAGAWGSDVPDDIGDADLGQDVPRDAL